MPKTLATCVWVSSVRRTLERHTTSNGLNICRRQGNDCWWPVTCRGSLERPRRVSCILNPGDPDHNTAHLVSLVQYLSLRLLNLLLLLILLSSKMVRSFSSKSMISRSSELLSKLMISASLWKSNFSYSLSSSYRSFAYTLGFFGFLIIFLLFNTCYSLLFSAFKCSIAPKLGSSSFYS